MIARQMIPETTLVGDPKSRFWGPFLTKFWSKLEVFWGSWGLIVVSIGTRGSRTPWGLILSLWGASRTHFISIFGFQNQGGPSPKNVGLQDPLRWTFKGSLKGSLAGLKGLTKRLPKGQNTLWVPTLVLVSFKYVPNKESFDAPSYVHI